MPHLHPAVDYGHAHRAFAFIVLQYVMPDLMHKDIKHHEVCKIVVLPMNACLHATGKIFDFGTSMKQAIAIYFRQSP